MELPGLVDLATVTHAQNEDKELVVLVVVDDAVVAGADPPLTRATDELGCSWRSRFGGEQLERCLDASAYRRVELSNVACGGGASVTR